VIGKRSGAGGSRNVVARVMESMEDFVLGSVDVEGRGDFEDDASG
jgi:hypothetical protein